MFQLDWEAPQVNEVISDAYFFEELFQGYKANLRRKLKGV